jgi:FkbM family methyltransferase
MPGNRTAEAVRYAAALARLGPSAAARLKIFLSTLYLAIRSRLGRGPGRPLRLRLASGGDSFSAVVNQISDLHAVDEVLLRDQYELPARFRPRTIVDLGSHIGISVAFFRLRYPEARIFAFEPNPASFGKLEQNVAEFEDVTVHRLAVSGRGGRSFPHTGASPLLASLKGSGGESVEVETATLDEHCQALGIGDIDLLKIDVEGAELEVLSSFDGLEQVGAIVGELHPELIGAPIEQFLALLDEFEVETEPAGTDLLFRAVRTAP